MANKDISVQMTEILDEINDEVMASAKKSFKEIGKEAVSRLRNTSPKKTGDYAKGWAYKDDGLDSTVYNKTDWQLTHLLERGHAIVNKKGRYGTVNGIKHIEPVNEWVASELPIRISEGIK